MHPACLPEDELLKSCVVGRGRAGGPGGQHRNKVETLVTITHEPTGISAHAGERRSQIENKRVAIRRLRLALATKVREPTPRGELGSALWRSRLRPPGEPGAEPRIVCNEAHADYPALLAEALDALADAGWEPRDAGLRLGVSGSSLVRLVAGHKPAFALLNEARSASGLRPLK